jgi:hypothetical protein
MVIMLEEYTTEEQRSVGKMTVDKEMFPVYGGKCLLPKAVHN